MKAPPDRQKQLGPRTGLSLDRFAAAKTTTYDKRVVLARKRHLKAQRLRRYTRFLERTGVASTGGAQDEPPVDEADPYDTVFAHGDTAGPSQPPPRASEAASRGKESAQVQQQKGDRDTRGGGRRDAAPGVAASHQGRGKFNALELLAKRREEAEAAELQAEAEAAAAAAERDAAREAAVARRRAQSVAMRKKNARGQPVMKHRMEAILDKLQRNG